MKNELKYSKILEGIGLSREQAEGHLRVIEEAMLDNVTTKVDISELRVATKLDLSELREATKSDIDELREATRSDISKLQASTKSNIDELRVFTKLDIKELKTDVNKLKVDVARVEAGLTSLGVHMNSEFKSVEHRIVSTLTKRLVVTITTAAAFVGGLVAVLKFFF